ncbi:hypothetical protein ACFV85_23325 [Streptomyces niveus]|uniref:hypothetical protein n=1 Tax=Streptomyces niveus TaxID=193462 RepID=UPI00364F01DC
MSRFRQESSHPGWSDWQLAREAVQIRRMVSYSDDPAEADRRIAEAFTAAEADRIDAFLEAGTPDTGRLAAIEARLAEATDDTTWPAAELKRAWALMDELRDRIDNGGSLMDINHVSSAIGYVQWSRKTP